VVKGRDGGKGRPAVAVAAALSHVFPSPQSPFFSSTFILKQGRRMGMGMGRNRQEGGTAKAKHNEALHNHKSISFLFKSDLSLQ
jgi:hypothetical protein